MELTDNPPPSRPTDSVVRTRIIFALKRVDIQLALPAQAVFVTEENKKRKEAKSQRDLQRRIDALQGVDLFAPLDDDELLSLARSLHPAPFAAGEIITRQGAQAHWLYLVNEGDVSVRAASDGIETEIARMSDGSFFGEMSLMTGEPRSATVVALTDVDCYRLDAREFQELVKRRPDVAKPIAQMLAERRARRTAVDHELDAEARARKMAEDESDLLSKMKSFFGIGDSTLPSARALPPSPTSPSPSPSSSPSSSGASSSSSSSSGSSGYGS